MAKSLKSAFFWGDSMLVFPGKCVPLYQNSGGKCEKYRKNSGGKRVVYVQEKDRKSSASMVGRTLA